MSISAHAFIIKFHWRVDLYRIIMKRFAIIYVAFVLATLSIKASTWLTMGNYDISWYNNSDSEFTISTPRSLAGLAYIVNNGYSTFYGKTIHLGADIDLSENDWVSIGLGKSTYFQGNFDGANHFITGLKVTKDSGAYPYYGFFTYLNSSVIKDLTIIGYVSTYFPDQAYPETQMGGLAGYTANCHIKNVTSLVHLNYNREKTMTDADYALNMGGIVGESNKTTFEFCLNNGSLTVNFGRTGINGEYYDGALANVGGITGKTYSSDIVGCGNINSKFEVYLAGSCNSTSGYIRIGGILGSGATGSTVVKSCYNNAQKLIAEYYGNSYDNRIVIGGISATASYGGIDNGFMSNNYSSTIYYLTNTPNFYYGGIVGQISDFNSNSSRSTANYSPSYISLNFAGEKGYDGATSFTQEQMTEDAFLSELNIYPILNDLKYRWIRESFGFPHVSQDVSAGIVSVENCSNFFNVKQNTIHLKEPSLVYLYNFQGKCIYQGYTEKIDYISSGTYILVANGLHAKILIK